MEVELLKKALAREKLARKEAENIGETRSAELYSFNQQLQELIMTTNLFPEQNPNGVMRYSENAKTLIYTNKPGEEISSFLNNSSNKRLREKFWQELTFSYENNVKHPFDLQIDAKTIRFMAVPVLLKNYINIYTSDISDIKKTELRLLKITSTLEQAQKVAKMGSWELDLTTNNMVWSEELFYILHVDPEKFKPSHENYVNLLHPEDRQSASEAVNKAIKHKEEYKLIQRRVFENGKEIYVECRGQLGLGKDGKVNRLYGICIDVTDKIEIERVKEDFTKKLEEKVKERTAKLIKSEKKLRTSLIKEKELGQLKSSFVSTASHQFRTPLAVIQSNVGLLEMFANKKSQEEFEKYKKVNNRITGAISKMTELMDNVLILGKLTSGNIHYNPENVDLIEFLKPLINQFNSIQRDGRLIDFEIEGEASSFYLDSRLLSHALENLISNAFKYSTGKGNPLLRVIFKLKELIIIIKDYGIGIPNTEILNLFQPFFRANNVTEIKGTGLGLSIAKEYVEINKGEIAVQSTLGEGSCFEITFRKI